MDLYSMGFQAFKDGMTEIQIKTQPPQFRSGWRAAKADEDSKLNVAATLKVEKVERFVDKARYTVTWQDINSVMRFYPYTNISKVSELEPIEIGMKQMVWNKRDTIHTFASLRNEISTVYLNIVDAAYKFKYIDTSDFKKLGVMRSENTFVLDQEQITKMKHGY